MNNVIQRRGGVNLLDHFDLHVFEGEVLGLFFTDNHGKEDLIRLLLRNTPIDYGSVRLRGAVVNSYRLPGESAGAGVSLVSRDELLIDEMTVAENVFVMRRGFRKYIIDASLLRAQFGRFAAEFGATVDGGMPARDLPFVDRLIVQMLKAVAQGSRLIIVKDTGFSPGSAEQIKLRQHVRRFADSGISFLYISGDTAELLDVCDRIAVAERGRVMSAVRKEAFGERDFGKYYFKPDQAPFASPGGHAGAALEFSGVCAGSLRDMSFSVAEGEGVLLWDRSDSAIEKIVRLLSGMEKPASGRILVGGAPLFRWTGARARVSIIRGTPMREMVFEDMSYLENLCFRAADRLPSLWRKGAFRRLVREEYAALVGGDIDLLPPLRLSDESLYSLVYLREHLYRPRLLVLVRPFLNTDIRLKMHILSLVRMIRDTGAALLILDSSVSDSSAIADRILDINDLGGSEGAGSLRGVGA
ncbi:MAG: hypothetical protein LBR44_00430 [Clostridiales Family XIII bacterium]|nr:hypothetical protein [Clostridiales Family XIII bacterium]